MKSKEPASKVVSPLLIVGIVLLPIVFVWKLLEKGYTKDARRLGFQWLAFVMFVNLSRILGYNEQYSMISVLVFSGLISTVLREQDALAAIPRPLIPC